MTAPARTETYEVVAPKGAILRAKADKSSEMLGVLAAGSLVDVDRTMKLQICGTRRARVLCSRVMGTQPRARARARARRGRRASRQMQAWRRWWLRSGRCERISCAAALQTRL